MQRASAQGVVEGFPFALYCWVSVIYFWNLCIWHIKYIKYIGSANSIPISSRIVLNQSLLDSVAFSHRPPFTTPKINTILGPVIYFLWRHYQGTLCIVSSSFLVWGHCPLSFFHLPITCDCSCLAQPSDIFF